MKLTIGGMVGSMHAVNIAGEYRPTSTTSVKLKASKNFQNLSTPFNEYSLILREQISETFALEADLTTGKFDELKLGAKKSLNILSGDESTSSIEGEVRIRNDIVNSTFRLRNHIGDYYGTIFELNVGSDENTPMVTISSDVCFNLFQFEKLFRTIKANSLEDKNSKAKNVNLLFGISYGFDGFSVNFGVELAGITIKLPILFSSEMETGEGDVEITTSSAVLVGAVVGLFMGSTYLLKSLVDRRKKTKKQRKFLEQKS
jgi:hypothetical protein